MVFVTTQMAIHLLILALIFFTVTGVTPDSLTEHPGILSVATGIVQGMVVILLFVLWLLKGFIFNLITRSIRAKVRNSKGRAPKPLFLDSHEAKVIRVIDGDTVMLQSEILGGNGESETRTFRGRLEHIDAPELSQTGGIEAKQRLVELTRNLPLKVTTTELDRFGRQLVVLVRDDGLIINHAMVSEGHAFTYPSSPFYEDFKAVERLAKRRGLGFWGHDGPVQTPWDYRRQNS